MEQHFVTFYSPGTFCAENSTKPIDTWDTDKALEMAKEIKERHGATPYGFVFTTRSREEDELDSKESARSNMYYMNGVVLTLAEIKANNDPQDRILISNMECNKWDRVFQTTSGWKWTQPLGDKDVVLEVKQ